MNENEKVLLVESNQRSKANSHRIDAINNQIAEIKNENKAIYQIATSVEVMASRLGTIEEKVDETNKKVKETARKVIEVENRPASQIAQNVNSIKVAAYTAFITFVLSGILGAILFFTSLH